MKSISEIRTEFKACRGSRAELYEMYAYDTRMGVQKLIQKYQKQDEKLANERLRLKQMRQYEEKYSHCDYICGIDEVGRGPLAGPVVAAAVILPKDAEILYLNDSKKLSAKRREELYDEIQEKAIAIGIGMAGPARIDEINILQATYEAMRQAIGQLSVEPEVLLNDAVTIPEVVIPQVPIIKGDAKSVSIAAASVIAKVTRDRLMEEYDQVLAGYGFADNKGYGSAEHIAALRKLGPTPIHRRTFIKNFVCKNVVFSGRSVKRMKQNNRAVGTAYEQIAGRFLEKKGFQILEYNYRCRAGEIDLIARDREYLVFCEVKYRRTKSAGSALEAVDTKKQKRLYRCAQQYVAAHKIPDAAARFDVVAIEGNEVCHIENAFEGA